MLFAATDAPVTFIGHTHIAEYYALYLDDTIEHGHMQFGGELRLRDDCRYIINVGSVGQPRDLNPQASYVLYDTLERHVSWRRDRLRDRCSCRENGGSEAAGSAGAAIGRRPITMNEVALAEQSLRDDSRCFGCGAENELGLQLVFAAQPDGSVRGETVLRGDFQGWKGVAHGGIVMMMLDEAMGSCSCFLRACCGNGKYSRTVSKSRPPLTCPFFWLPKCYGNVVECSA